MDNFSIALDAVLKHEGGYVFDRSDPGGETYKGIARNINGRWEGWAVIDSLKHQTDFPKNLDNNAELQKMVNGFYRSNYWERINGDNIKDEKIAISIFDFAVNAGVVTSTSLTQMIVDGEPDGVMGSESINKINTFDPDYFLAAFTIAKIARYVSIVKKRPKSQKYFYGWVKRALGDN